MPKQPRNELGQFGSTGGKAKTGVAAVVTVAAVAGAVAVGGGAGAGGSAAAQSSPGQVVRANVSRSKQAAQRGKRADVWRGMRLKRLKEATRKAASCALNSYGEVREFFLRNPCRALDRMLFALADDQGGTMIVSVAWVRMPNTVRANEFRALVDLDGTGNVSPLAAGLVGALEVRFTGRYYDSRPAGNLVVVAEVEPLSGHPAPELLDGVAEVVAQLPPP